MMQVDASHQFKG